MKRLLVVLLTLFSLTALSIVVYQGQAVSGGKKGDLIRRAAQGDLKPAEITTKAKDGTTVTRVVPFFSDATIQAAQEALHIGAAAERLEQADASHDIANSDFSDIGGGKQTLGCAKRDSAGNVRVNQDCTFRRQAEEDITYNPANSSNLIAGQNDSRVGYNQCGIDFSTDNGKSWGDMLPPFRQHENAPDFDGPSAANPNTNTIKGDAGTYHTYDAGSDPAVAVDSQGRSFFSCVTFDVFSNASGLYVTQSPGGANGAFYFNVPSSISGNPTKRFLVVEDNSPVTFHDKNMISADRLPRTASHPTGDNVYVTWTVFKFDDVCVAGGGYCESPIYGSMSTDHALTWSTPEEISGTSDTLCFFGNVFNPALNQHKCNLDQGSYSVTLPNGDLQVIFNNGNTPAGNPNAQQLGVHCKPTGSSSAGTAHLNCASAAKVGDDIVTGEPTCNFGRGPEECIPGAFIRTNDFPRITKDNAQNNHLQAVWQDYRNGEFDIQLSISTDGGLHWTEVGKVNPDTGLDHYFAAVDQNPSGGDRGGDDRSLGERGGGNGSGGDRIGVSYYRTQRVPGENTTPSGGFAPGTTGVQASKSDYVLAGGTGSATPYDFVVVSPVFPAPDGAQAGFNGDYSGLTINKNDEAHPIWSDTRNADPYTPANGVVRDEDVFTDKVNLPNGKGKVGPGTIGKN